MSRRGHIKDRTKLAAVLCIVLEIPHEHQELMHEEHVLSLVEWDHWPVRKVDGGSDRFSNMRPLLIGAHAEKTAKRDIPEIAKGKRIRRREQEHSAKVAVMPSFPDDMTLGEVFTANVARFGTRGKQKIARRGFPKQHRRLRSGNNLKRRQRP